jgi:hypothetical protein
MYQNLPVLFLDQPADKGLRDVCKFDTPPWVADSITPTFYHFTVERTNIRI